MRAVIKTSILLGNQVKSKEQEVSALETIHTTMKTQYEQRIRDLESKIAKTMEKAKFVEYRRTLDLEGFTNDISILRKQLLVLDRKLHQMRLLDQLKSDERVEAILKSLESKPALKKTGKTKGKKLAVPATPDVGVEIGNIRDSLMEVEKQIRSRTHQAKT